MRHDTAELYTSLRPFLSLSLSPNFYGTAQGFAWDFTRMDGDPGGHGCRSEWGRNGEVDRYQLSLLAMFVDGKHLYKDLFMSAKWVVKWDHQVAALWAKQNKLTHKGYLQLGLGLHERNSSWHTEPPWSPGFQQLYWIFPCMRKRIWKLAANGSKSL